MWRTKEPMAAPTSWADTDALNCHDMRREIMGQVVKEAIIPYYAAYMGERKDAAFGFA